MPPVKLIAVLPTVNPVPVKFPVLLCQTSDANAVKNTVGAALTAPAVKNANTDSALVVSPFPVPNPDSHPTVPILVEGDPVPLSWLMRMTVPDATCEVAVQDQDVSPVSVHHVPFHSLSVKKILAPDGIVSMATKARLSAISALYPTKRMDPAEGQLEGVEQGARPPTGLLLLLL